MTEEERLERELIRHMIDRQRALEGKPVMLAKSWGELAMVLESPIYGLHQTPKEERIPISYSQIRAFTTCRMKHHYLYDLNIEKDYFNPAISIGTCGHEATRAFLQGEDWLKAIEVWKTETAAKFSVMEEETWTKLEETGGLVVDILSRYLLAYRETLPLLKPVAVEQEFSIPIDGTRFDLVGRMDFIAEDPSGDLWLWDHKFVGRFRKEEDLLLDTQLALYQWAAFEMGYDIRGTIFNQLLAKPVSKPEPLKSGKGLSKVAINCTWEDYKTELLRYGFDPKEYEEEMSFKLRDKRFFEQTPIIRSRAEIFEFAYDIVRRIEDLANRNAIYMNESSQNCTGCEFRPLCIERMKGRDITPIIETEYRQRKGTTIEIELPSGEEI